MLFRGDAEFIAAGNVTAIFSTERITDSFDAWSADAEDLLEEDEPEVIVKRLIEVSEFDPFDASHLELVRSMLAGFPSVEAASSDSGSRPRALEASVDLR